MIVATYFDQRALPLQKVTQRKAVYGKRFESNGSRDWAVEGGHPSSDRSDADALLCVTGRVVQTLDHVRRYTRIGPYLPHMEFKKVTFGIPLDQSLKFIATTHHCLISTFGCDLKNRGIFEVTSLNRLGLDPPGPVLGVLNDLNKSASYRSRCPQLTSSSVQL